MSIIRRCTKAGSWYPFESGLRKSIKKWMGGVKQIIPTDANCKAVIGPHAGLSYCGETSSWGYGNCMGAGLKHIETVFVLGPSHYHYMSGCALSVANVCKTPLRDLTVDREIIKDLTNTGKFKKFGIVQEEQEHSLELHFPFIAHAFPKNIKIVPIIIGEMSKKQCEEYASAMLKYFDDDKTFFVVSSDFCHWGPRFGFTYHDSSKFSKPWQSIEDLDKRGVNTIISKDPGAWDKYIKTTNNSVCGKKPIWLLMEMVKQSQNSSNYKFKMTHYSQSDKVQNMRGSSVSYASVVLY